MLLLRRPQQAARPQSQPPAPKPGEFCNTFWVRADITACIGSRQLFIFPVSSSLLGATMSQKSFCKSSNPVSLVMSDRRLRVSVHKSFRWRTLSRGRFLRYFGSFLSPFRANHPARISSEANARSKRRKDCASAGTASKPCSPGNRSSFARFWCGAIGVVVCHGRPQAASG